MQGFSDMVATDFRDEGWQGCCQWFRDFDIEATKQQKMLKDAEGTIPTCTYIQFWHVLSISESNVKPNPNRLLFARNLRLQFDEFPWKIVNHWRQSLSFECFQLPGGLHKESSASNQAWKKNGAFNSVLCQMSFQCWLRLFKILISHDFPPTRISHDFPWFPQFQYFPWEFHDMIYSYWKIPWNDPLSQGGTTTRISPLSVTFHATNSAFAL